jgi:ketosteroid isomerase-like protein
MNTLDELLARDQIRQLAERYAVAVDGKDLDAIAGLFTEDVDNGRFGPGREGVKRYFNQSLRNFHCSMHLVANHVVDFDDDEHAHGIVYCQAHHHVLEPEHWFDLALAYWDTYERVSGDWFFRRRQPRLWYRQEFGYPDHGSERVTSTPASPGPLRGGSMPHAFPTFDAFWSDPPPGGSSPSTSPEE